MTDAQGPNEGDEKPEGGPETEVNVNVNNPPGDDVGNDADEGQASDNGDDAGNEDDDE